jgi:hypothetical protein
VPRQLPPLPRLFTGRTSELAALDTRSETTESTVTIWVIGGSAWSDDRLSIHELTPSSARELYLHWPAGRTQSPLAIRTREIAIDVAHDLANR